MRRPDDTPLPQIALPVFGYKSHIAIDRRFGFIRADFGLMVWDGASPGTCLNILRLAVIGSPCVVYDTMRGWVAAIHNTMDWQALVRHAGTDVRRSVEARMTSDERLALAD